MWVQKKILPTLSNRAVLEFKIFSYWVECKYQNGRIFLFDCKIFNFETVFEYENVCFVCSILTLILNVKPLIFANSFIVLYPLSWYVVHV